MSPTVDPGDPAAVGTEPGPVYLIGNPAAGRGRGARLIPRLVDRLRAAGADFDHALTTRPGHDAELAAAALERGFRRIVAVGGDGTWGGVGGAIVASRQPAALGLIAGGTGCDFAKTLGVPAQDPERALDVVLAGRTRRVDVGRVEDRHFLNVAGFGLDIAVIEDTWRVKWLRGDLLYLYCALRQVRQYPGFPVEIEADGGPVIRERLLMLMISNARIFGGQFQLAPTASVDDGRLDTIAFRDMPTLRRLAILGRLRNGTHVGAPEVSLGLARTLRLRFEAPPAFETDGDWNQAGGSEVTVSALPSALSVLVP